MKGTGIARNRPCNGSVSGAVLRFNRPIDQSLVNCYRRTELIKRRRYATAPSLELHQPFADPSEADADSSLAFDVRNSFNNNNTSNGNQSPIILQHNKTPPSHLIIPQAHAAKQPRINLLRVRDKELEIHTDKGEKHRLSHVWLRDNCRCTACNHPVTFQRQLNSEVIPNDLKPLSAIVSPDGANVKVVWPAIPDLYPMQQGAPTTHTSTFSLPWLLSKLHRSDEYIRTKKTRVLWNKKAFETKQVALPAIGYDDVMHASNVGLLAWLDLIHTYGFAIVRNIPVTPEETRKVIERISHTQSSIFGDFWDFTVASPLSSQTLANAASSPSSSQSAATTTPSSTQDKKLGAQGRTEDLNDYGDTAYTNAALGAHTDGSYYNEPPGLQFFRILSHNGTGGDTTLVDGFKVAENLKQQYPDAFNYLCSHPMRFVYKDANNLISAHETIFRLDEEGEMEQIRYNNDDRASSYMRPEKAQEMYNALTPLLNQLKSEDNTLRFLLTPGDLLVTNNWRVLHGRTKFDGDRRLAGAYLRMQDFQSRTRVLTDASSTL